MQTSTTNTTPTITKMSNSAYDTTQLQKDLLALHTQSPQAIEWFRADIKALLENQNFSQYAKSDILAELFLDVYNKIGYIKEKLQLLTTLKKEFELAKAIAKEEIAKLLLEYGIEKLEGIEISSITVAKPTIKTKAKLLILDEDELYNRGYFKVELDLEAIEKALLSADQRHEVEQFADFEIERVEKPAIIRINKRKKANIQTPPNTIAA